MTRHCSRDLTVVAAAHRQVVGGKEQVLLHCLANLAHVGALPVGAVVRTRNLFERKGYGTERIGQVTIGPSSGKASFRQDFILVLLGLCTHAPVDVFIFGTGDDHV